MSFENNINESAEPFKSIGFAMKKLAQEQHNVNAKILRALRNHEVRIDRIEKKLSLNNITKYGEKNVS